MRNTTNPGRVLVVEDEPIVNMAVSEALRDDGFEPISVYTAEEGLAILERERDVRVVFTDVNLPGQLDGIALVHEVRRRWPQIEVLVTSGNRRPQMAEWDSGGWYGRFVEKPYPPAAVVRRIQDIVSSRDGGGSGSSGYGA